jgi:hypothetical protein
MGLYTKASAQAAVARADGVRLNVAVMCGPWLKLETSVDQSQVIKKICTTNES